MSEQDCQHGMTRSIQDCKCECYTRDNTPETPNLEDYKTPSYRELEHNNEELEAHAKRS
jgi:hypothetical protein